MTTRPEAFGKATPPQPQQSLPMVGKDFLPQIGATILAKCPPPTSLLHIFPNRLRFDFLGIFIIPFILFGNFFSFRISGQRKEAKERHLILAKIGQQKDTPFRWLVLPFFGQRLDIG